jgi:hypothetical protein
MWRSRDIALHITGLCTELSPQLQALAALFPGIEMEWAPELACLLKKRKTSNVAGN